MKIIIAMACLFLAWPATAGCPLLTHDDPAIQREFQNVCQNILGDPLVISSATIGDLTVSTLTAVVSPPSGSCYNIQIATTVTPTATASTSFVVTTLSKSITLHNSANRVRITVMGEVTVDTQGENGTLTVFAGTARDLGNPNGTGLVQTLVGGVGVSNVRIHAGHQVIDSPLLAGSTTYTVMIKSGTATTTFAETGVGTLTLEECVP